MLVKNRFRLHWQTTSIEDGWVLTVLSVTGTKIGSFWIDEDEVEDLLRVLKDRGDPSLL